jgi:hypothetical protein
MLNTRVEMADRHSCPPGLPYTKGTQYGPEATSCDGSDVSGLRISALGICAEFNTGKKGRGPARCCSSPRGQPDANDFGDLLRKDVRSLKKQIIAQNMELSDAEAEKFWPVYDQYAAELSRIYDTKLSLLNDYADNYSNMTDDQAESYIRKRAEVEQSIMQLRLKYLSAFRKVLSGRETALFYQMDWRLGLAIDVQLIEVPLFNQ